LQEGGSKSWEPMEELKKDVPDDVDSLLRSEEASVGRVETEHVPEKPMMTSFKCDRDHSNYQLHRKIRNPILQKKDPILQQYRVAI